MSIVLVEKYNDGLAKYDSILIDSINIEIGGQVNISRPNPSEIPDEADEARVLETEDPENYLTVQKRSGNNQWTYEYCFRLERNSAVLETLTRMEDGKDCSKGWIPDEVRDSIHHHHPNLTIKIS